MKYFDVSNPAMVVTILNEDATFIHLSDGNMIRKDTFQNKYQPVLGDAPTIKPSGGIADKTVSVDNSSTNSDVIDPASFFSKSGVVEQVKSGLSNVDPSKLSDVVPPSEVRDRMSNQPIQQTQQPQQPQSDGIVQRDHKMDEIEQLFDNEKLAYGEAEANKRRLERIAVYQGIGQPKQQETQQSTTINGQEQVQTTTQHVQPQQPIDPSEMMFKSFKRNHKIDINVNFKDKIANPDFVKMMMENMDGDIVSFYKKLIMDNILSNVKFIENEVEHSINVAIYGENYKDLIDEDEDDGEQDSIEGVRKEAIDVSNALQEHVDNGGILSTLIEGKKTSSGKQTYKYVDDNGKVKELLPESAKKKGYKPYVEANKEE